jgi:hypothetical protein
VPRSTTETGWPRNSRTVVPSLKAVRDTGVRAWEVAVLAALAAGWLAVACRWVPQAAAAAAAQTMAIMKTGTPRAAGFPSAPSAHPEVSQLRGAGPFYCRPSTRASMGGSPMVLRCCLRLYEAVTGPAAVFHLKLVPDVPPISPATQNWLVVPVLGAAAL